MKKEIKNLKGLALMGVLMLSTASFAQDAPAAEAEAPKTTFGGNLDTYYKLDASRNVGNGLTSFSSGTHNSFELGMASVYAEHNFGKASVFVDLGFGKRAEEFSYVPGSTVQIKQAYLSLEAMEGLKFTMGSWATHIGVELVNASDNRNYSMSYAFSNGPFQNTGVKADYAFGEFNVMLGVTQPTDARSALHAGTTQKTVIGQFGYTTDDTSIYINGTSGSTNPGTLNVTQGDLVVNQKIDDKFSVTLNGTYAAVSDDNVSGSKNWFSTVAYLKYDYSDKIKLTYRTEYFGDKDGVSTSYATLTSMRPVPGTGLNVFSNTLSLGYNVGNLTIIPEIRLDAAKDKVFVDADSNLTKTNVFFVLGTAYRF